MQFVALFLLLSVSKTISLLKTNNIKYYSKSLTVLKMATSPIKIGDIVPEGIIVDIVGTKSDASGTPACQMNDSQDLGKLLKSLKKAVVFAVPG